MASILVIDDRPTNREFLVTLLAYAGHRTLEASNGAVGLERARQERPDLVITDILMPTMDGYELVQNLRDDSESATIPVIFYTAAYRESVAKALAMACGVSHVLPKPSDPERILKTVNEALGAAGSPLPTLLPTARSLGNGKTMREHVLEMGEALSGSFAALRDHHERIAELVDTDGGRRDALVLFSESLADLHAVVLRLSGFSELLADLATENDSRRLLERSCAEARSLVGCAYAVVCVLDDNERTFQHFLTSGLDPELAARIECPPPDRGLLGRILREGRPVHMQEARDHPLAGLPSELPPARSFLGVPISSGTQRYGVLYFGNKLGAEEFGAEDEAAATALAAEIALHYEKTRGNELLQRHAARLQLEVTEHKRTKAELERRMRELAQSNSELENYAYIASHDLQEPLRSVTGFLQLLADRYKDRLDPDADKFIGIAVDGVVRMRELIHDLLAYSRVSTSGGPPAPADSEAALAAALTNLRLVIEESGAVITHDPLPRLLVDEAQLVQVFQNLLANALKFGRERPPKVHVSATRGKGEWILSVQDRGIGIEPKHFESIFHIFQRLHTRNEYEGTGIGLAVCKKIVERQGGRIWLESEPGKGSVFSFALPEIPEEQPPSPGGGRD